MSDDRKKPGVAFWATVVVVVAVLVLYPLSFGPWCWFIVPEREGAMSSSFYRPILWVWYHSPSPLYDCMAWYTGLVSDYDVSVGVTADGTLCLGKLEGFPDLPEVE
jgi:hypothetical protein